jgi:hypothetical protein
MGKLRTKFKIGDADRVIEVQGQEARALNALVAAGTAGITSLEVSTWALRLAHYCFKLKKQGLIIECERERHGGPVPGKHGRYRLHTPVQIVEIRGAA